MTHKQAEQLLEMLSTIVLNAELHPDPRMSNTTDCYLVPCEDIDAADKLLGKIRAQQ